MKLDDFLKFKGNGQQLNEYQELLTKREKCEKQIKRLSLSIYDEEDSISVFVGDLSERDLQLLQKHIDAKEKYQKKLEAKQKEFERLEAEIKKLQK